MTTETTLRPSWFSGEQAPSDILLPVYYSWEFRTSDGGDPAGRPVQYFEYGRTTLLGLSYKF